MLKKRLHFDTSPESVAEKLSEFPERYRCYHTKNTRENGNAVYLSAVAINLFFK